MPLTMSNLKFSLAVYSSFFFNDMPSSMPPSRILLPKAFQRYDETCNSTTTGCSCPALQLEARERMGSIDDSRPPILPVFNVELLSSLPNRNFPVLEHAGCILTLKGYVKLGPRPPVTALKLRWGCVWYCQERY